MKSIDVYKQYFSAECEVAGAMRHGACVAVTAESDNGNISYTASVNFFPHVDEEDYGITYDAIKTSVIYEGKGRRSKKREAELLESMRETMDALADEMEGTIFWDEPLSEAELG